MKTELEPTAATDAPAGPQAPTREGQGVGVPTQAGIPGTIQAASSSTVKTELELTAATGAEAGFAARVEGGGTLGCTPNMDGSAATENSPARGFDSRDEELNSTVSIYQAELADWKLGHLSLSDLASQLHDWADELWTEFVPAQWKGRAVPKPGFFFVFDREPSRILGHYHCGRNQAGIRWEISVNPTNLSRLSQIQVGSIVLHEEFHAFEDIVGSAPRSRNGYHSRWLRNIADQLGIPCTRFGCTCGIRPDSPFMQWASRRALQGTPVLNAIPETVQPAKQKKTPALDLRLSQRARGDCLCALGFAAACQV